MQLEIGLAILAIGALAVVIWLLRDWLRNWPGGLGP